jgi:hypothetical protein
MNICGEMKIIWRKRSWNLSGGAEEKYGKPHSG